MIRILFVISICLCVGTAGAEQDMEYPAGGKPTVVPRNLLADVSQPLKCMVHTEGAPIFSRPASPSSVMAKAKFRDTFYVAGIDESGKYLFLVTAATEQDYPVVPVRTCHGWIQKGHCLEFHRDDARQGPESLTAAPSPIHRKAMLVNRLEGEGGVRMLTEKIPFTDRPDDRGNPLQPRALFSIYYVFAETPTHSHFLLGQEPRIKDWVADKSDLLGWVPRQRVCQWNTREAVEFNKRDLRQHKRTQPCRIFLEPDQLKVYLEKADPEQVPPVAEEDMSLTEWRFDQARFPLVEADAGPSVIHVRGNTLYRIGFIGDVFRQSASGNRVERLATAQQIDDLRARVETLQRRIAKVQLCFIIDGTFSMDPWIKAAADAVNEIITGVTDRAKQAKQLEISVNYYRNQRDQPKDLEFHGFRRAAEARILLDNAEPFGGGDQHEQMFLAICRRLQAKDDPNATPQPGETTPSPMAFDANAVKILVLIGDDGNDPNDKTYTVDEVCRQIRAVGGTSPIAFLAFPVGKGSRKHLFVDQAKQISAQLAQAELATFAGKGTVDADLKKGLEALTAQVKVTSSSRQIIDTICARFDLAITEKTIYQRCLECLHAGSKIPDDVMATLDLRATSDKDVETTRRTYGVIWKNRMEDMIRDQKLETLQLAAHGVQLFREGWIAERDPQETAQSGERISPSIQHVVLMNKGEVDHLAEFLRLVVDNFQTRPVQQVWKESLNAVTGGEVHINPQMTLTELMQMHFGIKVRSENSLLALNFDELGRRDPAQLVKLRDSLDRSRCRLADILRETEADYVWTEVGETGRRKLQRLNPRSRRYWWFGEGREDAEKEARAWIDRDLLP